MTTVRNGSRFKRSDLTDVWQRRYRRRNKYSIATASSEGTIRSAIASEYQTNSGLRVYGTSGGYKKWFSWNVYADYKAAHDYHNKYDGFVFNSKFYNKNYGAMLGYRGNWGSSRILVTSFDQHIGNGRRRSR